jgi:DNA-binding CsgD family transcriptional regulator
VHDNVLRPVERRVLRLAGEGVDDAEIARRFRHSEEWVARVRELAEVPRTRSPVPGDILRPVERRVLRWRAAGAGYEELSPRFRRSPKFIEQVESLALYKLRGPQ